MRFVLAALLFIAVPAANAGTENPAVAWLDDLSAACEKADAERKLVLYRQVVCPCTGKDCPVAEAARKPWYLESEEARRRVAGNFVTVTAHVAPKDEMKGLLDLGYGSLLTQGAPLRTFILTPSRHILHRLDLCGYSSDLEGELDYALMVKLLCFDLQGRPEPGAEQVIRNLHENHVEKPRAHHKKGWGSPASEWGGELPKVGAAGSRKPWTGYGTIAWHTNLEEARALAKHCGRLVLYYQIVGDLYKEGC